MKTVLMTLVILALAVPCFGADVYAPVTKADEVQTIGEVVVSRTQDVQMGDTWTLDKLDAEIADRQAQVTRLQNDITNLQVVRAKVATEAAKVKLYVAPEPEVIEGP